MKNKRCIYSALLMLSLCFIACGQENKKTATADAQAKQVSGKPGNPYYSHTSTKKLNLSDAEWKKVLPGSVYEIAREAGTERPYTGKYWKTDAKGTYYCAACGNKLFDSKTKFHSGTGWPSFYEVADSGSVVLKEDHSLGMTRTEVLCARCGAHLGHLFNDGPRPTGKRYCMNSAILDFIPD